MAKKKKVSKKMNNVSLIKRGVALLASVITFVFFFLNSLALKTKASLLGLKAEEWESEGVSFTDVLFNEDFEFVREKLSLTTTILWIVFVLAILSIVVLALSFVMKNSLVAKVGSGLLVVGMVLLFVVNFTKADFTLLGTGVEGYVSNITGLYFVGLALSLVGFASVATLKK